MERGKWGSDPPIAVVQYSGIFRLRHFNYMVSKCQCQYSCPLLAGVFDGFGEDCMIRVQVGSGSAGNSLTCRFGDGSERMVRRGLLRQPAEAGFVRQFGADKIVEEGIEEFAGGLPTDAIGGRSNAARATATFDG